MPVSHRHRTLSREGSKLWAVWAVWARFLHPRLACRTWLFGPSWHTTIGKATAPNHTRSLDAGLQCATTMGKIP